MALTHVTTIRDVLTDAVVDAIDAGSADTTGDLVLMTAGEATVATLTWTATPAFGASSSGEATMNAINDDTNAVGGDITLFKFVDRDNAEVFRGSVSLPAGGGDIELSSLSIGAGDTVSITSATYTAPV